MEKEIVEVVEEVVEVDLKEVVDNYEDSLNQLDETNERVSKTLDEINADQEEIAESLANRENDLFKKEVALELKSNGLDAFQNIVKVNTHKELEATIEILKGIVGNIKTEAGYIPKDSAKQNVYDVHAQNKDTKSMIGSKLANLFK